MRLIDDDALYEILKEHWHSTEDYEEDSYDMGNAIGFNNGINHAEHHVLCAPTVDAKPVKHGRWTWMRTHKFKLLTGDTAYTPLFVCSCCNHIYESYTRYDEPSEEDADFPNYCEQCGAKMDLEED